jgi:hypothetical protein
MQAVQESSRLHGLLERVLLTGEGMYFVREECVILIDRLG